jgi:hypothetical protein
MNNKQNTRFISLLMILVLTAVACSLPARILGNSAPPAAETEPTSEPQQEQPSTETAETETEEQATQSDGGGDDAAEEQATEEPEPTDQEKETEAEPAVESACANALMPMAVGNQWVYEQTTSEGIFQFTWTVTSVGETSATFEMKADDPQMTATYTVDCEDNAINTFPTMGLELMFGGGGMGTADIAYTHSSGVFLPSPETLAENDWTYDWETQILISGDIESTQGGQTFNVNLDESPWNLSWQAVGQEAITTDVGEFPKAVKVIRENEMTMNVAFEGQQLSATLNSTETQWYSPQVGMIKSQTEETNFDMQGISVPFPQEQTKTVTTLIAFNQAE